jgi:hypothetical protein
MPMSRQQRGRIGGLERAALTPDRRQLTEGMRRGRWQKYVDRVLGACPELAGDEAEITRRAEMLRRAEMIRMSERAAEARRQLREAEAALAAEAGE